MKILESTGLKRTLASILAVLAVLPPLAPYQSVIVLLAGAVGGVGIAHPLALKIAGWFKR